MLSYSLRLALRHFFKKRIYSSIIVLSLTTGFACTCLLVSFLIAESRTDSFHTKIDRLYQLTSDDPFGGSLGTGRIPSVLSSTTDYLESTYPEVENICKFRVVQNFEIEVNGEYTLVTTASADTSFFTMFDFPLIAGSARELTKDGIMIRSEKAKQLFGTEDVVGKMVSIRTTDTTRLMSIAGVIGKTPEKSHLAFDALVLNDNAPDFGRGSTYLLLHENADVVGMMAKVNADSLRPTLLGKGKLAFYLDPMKESYNAPWNVFDYTNTRSKTFLQVAWIVCGLILFMACFNFVNLFLLSMQERKKETGIQKTLGISLWQTVKGSGIEAIIYIGLSFVLSLIVAYTLMPIFNNALNADLKFEYFSRLRVLALMGGLLLLIASVVISISTVQQRKVAPVSMMRNLTARVRSSKLFFTIQFFVSITLCVCTITIIKQMKYLENEPLGFNRIIIQVNSPDGKKNLLPQLKNEILRMSEVKNVALSQGNPISGNMIMMAETEDGRPLNPYLFSGDEDMIKTLDLKLVQGSLEMNSNDDVLVNEALVKFLDLTNPIGAKIPSKDFPITGVVKDFTCSSFKTAIPPAIISYQENGGRLLVDYSNSDLGTLLPKLKAAWTSLFPDDYFSYSVIQDDLMKKYSEETLFYRVVLASSITSMIISCFGLFALSWAVIKSRAREMGIRKVLGASVTNILSLLTLSFAKRLLVAFVLAAPAGYYLMNLWLSRFVNKTTIDTWVFVSTGVTLATIAIFTLGVQTLKASLSSPLNEIKE